MKVVRLIISNKYPCVLILFTCSFKVVERMIFNEETNNSISSSEDDSQIINLKRRESKESKESENFEDFEIIDSEEFQELSCSTSLSSDDDNDDNDDDDDDEFNSIPEEFIPSDDEEINLDQALLDELLQVGPDRLIKRLKECSTPGDTLKAFGFQLPPQYIDYPPVWELIKDILLRYVYVRPRNPLIPNTLEAARELVQKSKKIVIISGAGISVAAGIPDFRSEKSGLYAQISRSFPQLPCAEAMFDLGYFLEDPYPFYTLCKSLLCEQARPTRTHHFIKRLEEEGRLLMDFTQNIDTLEEKAGIERVLYCHGSFSSAHCLSCNRKYTLAQFQKILQSESTEKIDDLGKSDEIGGLVTSDLNTKVEGELVLCEDCGGLVKPDIVFFGESLPEDFHKVLPACMEDADLLIVIGSSLKVQPVGTIPDLLLPSIPQILINKEPILDHNFDIVLLGDCQEIVQSLIN